ncbi:MAG: hypothetical protein QOJ09_374 [Actinomycetota bacterium]|jgi:hypothetical protein|nr:hypothetical protein [Actinomycetota bacterium]
MSDERVESRAELLPEEERAGSDDPEAQAGAILEESDARSEHPVPREQRTSEDTVEPPD